MGEDSVTVYVRGTGDGVLRLSIRRRGPPTLLSPVRPHRTFDIPSKLSECAESIANWDSILDSLPSGWDDHEFRLVGEPYPWCETLANGCNCHGSEDELSAAYCSDFGLAGDTEQRASKSPNVRYVENLKGWEERATARERKLGRRATVPRRGYPHG